MYIKIAPEKIQFTTPMLNSEPILIKILSISETTSTETIGSPGIPIKLADVRFGAFVESNYIASDKPYIGDIFISFDPDEILKSNTVFNLTEIDNEGNITEKKPYETTLSGPLKEWLETSLNLEDTDLEIISEAEWRETQPIRLTIPAAEFIETDYYRNLMNSLVGTGIINYKTENNYIFYLAYLKDEDRAVMEADENVLIEE